MTSLILMAVLAVAALATGLVLANGVIHMLNTKTCQRHASSVCRDIDKDLRGAAHG